MSARQRGYGGWVTAHGRTPLTCPVCGAAAHPKDRFCPACGADLAVGDEQTSLVDELMPFGAEPVDQHPTAPEPDLGVDEPRRRGAVAPLLVLVVVVVVALLAWRLAPGDGDDAGIAAPSASPSASGPQDVAPSASPTGDGEEPAATDTPSPTDSPRAIDKAAGASRCGEARDGAVAWRGNDVTSCEFAVETAKEVVDASADLPTTVTARSPVTNKDYEMTCEDTAPVRCRGGDDALVYVDLAAR